MKSSRKQAVSLCRCGQDILGSLAMVGAAVTRAPLRQAGK